MLTSKKNVIINKLNEKCPEFKPLSAKINVIPLRSKPKPGENTVPLLVNFASAEQKALAEKTLKNSGFHSVPNYSRDFYDLIKKIRDCIKLKNPGKQILIRPNSSYRSLTIKVRDNFESRWVFLTTTQLPFTEREMKNCCLKKNPCNNEIVNI